MPLPLRLWTLLLGGVLLVMLVLGFAPQGDFTNHARRLKDLPGLKFEKFAMAHTEPFPAIETAGLSIEIAVTAPRQPDDGFSHILVIHGGDDRRQLLIGQWRSWIIVMNGDDYRNREKRPRIAYNTADAPSASLMLTVVSDRGGTWLYVNGALVRHHRHFVLTSPPSETGKIRLVVGNSVYGRHHWSGTIYGLALYGRAIPAEHVASHHRMWRSGQSFRYALKAAPALLYLFDENAGSRVIDHAGGGHHLVLPDRVKKLNRRFLQVRIGDHPYSANFRQDVVVNLVGFIPFGILLGLVLLHLPRMSFGCVLLTVLASGAVLSLSIEMVQAWLPSRHSSLLDLSLNTLGAGIGALIAMRLRNSRGKSAG